ncbi:putative phosphatase regulatory subunit-domain-containing protein [Radiomyces spectabilis]|uniref:putative phosphatase regulatory subunit-domain-containing protein n=1 Tax=Radiomyces spectabilis TaxID=64574 RepID=UPI00221F79AD|nr:putative phosphatase regulatory subunit-domain-containing protein [Radiomyces spectabilis]KAI8391198.1 putative phosphatase regulatory subunit-domain-containing protein [Radiomyces spectabilis]
MSLTVSSFPSSHFPMALRPVVERRVSLKRAPSNRIPVMLHKVSTNAAAAPTSNVNLKPKKTVRFREDLEDVRLFLKSQTPKAVHSDPIPRHELKYPNWPAKTTLYRKQNVNIRMENVYLDEHEDSHGNLCLIGRCRVANVAFEKQVKVRYTLDYWQTHHETIACYREAISSSGNKWDRFSFSIPVSPKQGAQTIYLALLYTVNGQDFWDNNNGHNYELEIVPQVPFEETSSENDLTDDEDEDEDIQNLIAPKERTKKLAQRYDFGASLSAARKPWSPPASPPTPVDEGRESMLSYPPSFFYLSKNYSFEPATTYSYFSPSAPKKIEPPISPAAPSPVDSPIFSSSPTSGGFDWQTGYQDFVSKYCFYSDPIDTTLSASPRPIRG